MLSLCKKINSSIGRKFVVAVTGLGLLGFIFGHMVGNLVVFLGADALNSYGHFLQTFLHGGGVWIARIGILAAFVLHIVFTILLVRDNRQARGEEQYQVKKYRRATSASRYMIVSGLVILAFIFWHLWQFTISPSPENDGYYEQTTSEQVSTAHSAKPRHDIYAMVIKGFQNPVNSVFYMVAIFLLCWHISHGFSSVFQTLGLRNDNNCQTIDIIGMAFAIIVLIGNCSIPIAILSGLIS